MMEKMKPRHISNIFRPPSSHASAHSKGVRSDYIANAGSRRARLIEDRENYEKQML